MKNTTWILTTLALAASLQLSPAADIAGKVTLKGAPPPEKTLDVIKDNKDCGPLHKAPVMTRLFVVGAGGALADAVVYLKGDSLKGKSTGASAPALSIDQKGCIYLPYVNAVQTKQMIKVKNSDPIMHNVHPAPAVTGNKESNKAQMPGGPEFEYTFENPEDFLKFTCNVHPWMFSYVSVFDHPYFAVTGENGAFTIKNVPAGKYTLEARHRKGGTTTQEIEVKDANLTADLTIELKEAK